jgi:arylsulfatase A-like enzyme
MYEEVMQVPMLWSWPGKIPVEAARPELVSSYDLVPSLCEAAQLPVPNRNLCGESYLTMAQGKVFGAKDRPWRSTVFGHFRNTEMARDNRFKLVLRDGGEGPNQLFDLSKDPRERLNLYENPQFVTVRDALASRLAAWREKYSS